MAVAAITLTEVPTTIETDGTGATITKTMKLMSGSLVNGGASKIWLAINGATIATTDAQVAGVVGLPAGASMPWLTHYTAIQHKTAGAAGVLYFYPDGPTTLRR